MCQNLAHFGAGFEGLYVFNVLQTVRSSSDHYRGGADADGEALGVLSVTRTGGGGGGGVWRSRRECDRKYSKIRVILKRTGLSKLSRSLSLLQEGR
jgi:hypothetical protein